MPIPRPRAVARLTPLAAALALTLLAGAARGEEFYYVAVFGSQTTPPDPNYTHSFAAFVKACGDGPCPREFVVEECFTISWLPRTLKVRTYALLPECGVNLPLHDALRYVLANHERVSLWGQYQINKELYCQAARQAALLESGRVKYKAVDSGFPTDRVSNCIHAIATPAGGYRVRVLSPGFGETASWAVLQRYKPFIIDSDRTHEWVFSYLGLEAYPIIRRDFDVNPRSGIFWSKYKSAFRVEEYPGAGRR